MDPDATLARIREITAEMQDDTKVSMRTWLHLAQELGEKIEALDNWISKGGFLPQAWENWMTANDNEER